MRIWSIHPQYLDPKGLVALWREALLAQKVLLNRTRGYKNHPQLKRFKNTKNPCRFIAVYLQFICDEADKRCYSFDRTKIKGAKRKVLIPVTKGQLKYELNHLRKKLWNRDRRRYIKIASLKLPMAHPMFSIVDGGVEEWERI